MREFTYSPFNYPNEIRVLALSPGHGGQDLEGSMQHIRLSTDSSPTPTNIQTVQPVQLPEHDSLPQATTFPYTGQPTPRQNTRLPYPTKPNPSSVWTWDHIASKKVDVLKQKRNRQIGVNEQVIRFNCTRREYSLQDYDALSYTWGDPSRTHSIIVNNKLLGIAQNLYTALIQLRSATEPRILWIDAICIDQDNIQERSHQVQMMRRVFSAASSVIVWLGDPQGNVDSTLDMVLDYNRREVPEAVFDYPEKPLIGLSNLFRRSWWKRIWIVQEVVVARELVILLGRTIFPWSFLANMCWGIQQNEFRPEFGFFFRPILWSCGYQKFVALDNFRQHRVMTLVGLLRSTQDYQASDPRDKLYALLGVASDVSAEDIIPDYTRPVQKVYEDLVKFMAVQRRSLDILPSGRLSSSDQVSPSWLPHWQVTSFIQPLSGENSSYRAAGDTRAVVDMSQFPLTLTVEGILADEVEVLDYSTAPLLVDWFWSTKVRLHSQSLGIGIVIKTIRLLWQMIVANKDHAGNRASPVLEEYLESFVKDTSQVNSRAAKDCSDAVIRTIKGRQFFTTKQGRMGLAPAGIQIEDRVAIVKGCHVPLILRPVESHWVLVGEAYVMGMMDGEVISGFREGRYKTRMIQLR
ncbi:hypothetical protein NM208_g11783 [Fusarium decemcellulare]|uniref:Uncharacterized protein n=1 Tax=Fusarium decemcellulare TaxID=57161 RepID=A0ACC1RTQ1_9HYPO|nr:hypothetical protein NM208_g11783 [Fusarium decemcellulare]